MAAAISALKLERPVLVGWSYGGFIICDYLRAHGEGAIAGINSVSPAVMLNAAYDNLGPGFLENAQDATATICPPTSPACDALSGRVPRGP